MSDALTIARWCWPGRPWRLIPDDAPNRFDSWRQSDQSLLYFYADDLNDIARAERILIERGLAEEYGQRLARDLFCPDLADEESSGILELHSGKQFSRLATAPLDARVRAMVAVIRALEAKA